MKEYKKTKRTHFGWKLEAGRWKLFSQNEPILLYFQLKNRLCQKCIPVFLYTCIPAFTKRTHFYQLFLKNEPI
jgi:hypothetical protein